MTVSITTPRLYSQQVVHFLRKSISYTMDGQTVDVGVIPAGSLVLKPMSGVHVVTAFNGGSTNTLDIGASTDSGTDNFASAISLGSTNFVACDETTGAFLVSVDTIVQAKVVSTAGASAGAGEIIICYIPDTDL